MVTPEALKREEMFERTGRFILALRRSGGQSRSTGPPKRRESADRADHKGEGKDIEKSPRFTSDDLLGYCSFRFDTEETQSPRDAEVIYWCVAHEPLVRY